MSITRRTRFHGSIRLPLTICAIAVSLLAAPVIAAGAEPAKDAAKAGMTMPTPPTDAGNMSHMGHMGDMGADRGMSMTGDVDYDFAVNMRRHHQMALMMSQAQLKNGKDASMRDLAKKIIAAQKEEITTIDLWIAAHHKANAK